MRSCTCERLADPRSKIICHNFGLAPVGQIKIKFIVSPRGQERVVSVLYGRVLAFSNASKWKPFWPFLQALVAGQNKTNLFFFFALCCWRILLVISLWCSCCCLLALFKEGHWQPFKFNFKQLLLALSTRLACCLLPKFEEAGSQVFFF